VQISEVIAPTSLADALAASRNHPNALFSAGGTTLWTDIGTLSTEPQIIISLHRVPEIKSVSRTDRYVEVGAMTPLSELLALKEGFIPEALREALRGIGTFAVRNVATIGGNLSYRTRFRDCFPVLACLDALAEFRSASSSRWVNLNHLIGAKGAPDLPKGELMTRIRIPLSEWNIDIVQKIGTPRGNSDQSALFIFLARTDKRTLSDFRIMYSMGRALRIRETEASIAGKKLPLSARDLAAIINSYSELCRQSEVTEAHRLRFLSLVRRAFALLGEGTSA
jgi:CO/xanthine dehydrogenase FAD-binding subunit